MVWQLLHTPPTLASENKGKHNNIKKIEHIIENKMFIEFVEIFEFSNRANPENCVNFLYNSFCPFLHIKTHFYTSNMYTIILTQV
ncbi:MAG: hypothetical protein A2Y81_11805 [Nitrospirae bacterium RBG_13_43_8]|nr:MAG: hypothetical protein A2Y81_11805 [Nitrospirae bacterium RBG_13_43_8]